MKKIYSVFAFLLAIQMSISAQTTIDNRIYISPNLDFPGFTLNASNWKMPNNLQIKNEIGVSFRSTFFIEVTHDFGAHVGFVWSNNFYIFDGPFDEPELTGGYFLGNSYNAQAVQNTTFSVFAGIGYKIKLKRFVLMPYVDALIIPYSVTSIEDYYIKEPMSNNVITYESKAEDNPNIIGLTAGIDAHFHIRSYWGFKLGIRYAYMGNQLDITTVASDFYNEQKVLLNSMNFNRHDLTGSVGVFWSLGKKSPKE